MEYGNRAYVLTLINRLEAARPWAEKSARLLADVAAANPTNEYYLNEAAYADGILAALLVCLGELQEAEAPYREQRRLLEKFAASSGPAREQLAWLLANCPVPSVRDPAAARALAEELERSPGGADGRMALAALFNRLDRHREAAALLEPLAAKESDKPIDFWAQLAIAHHQLGQKEEAAESLRRAAKRVRAGESVTIDRRLLLAEVNDLLGEPEPVLRLPPPTAQKTRANGK